MKQITEIPKPPSRQTDSHKGTFGKVCVVAGSFGMSGAACLIGTSALRSGSGLVTLAVPKSILPIVAALEPSYTTTPLAEDDHGMLSKAALPEILNHIDLNDSLAIGPGLGQSPDLKYIIEKLIAQPDLKMVLDADGLNNLAKISNWHKLIKARIILTPHPGEMKRLYSSIFREPLPDNRIEQAVTLARKTNTTVVLKGAGTIVAQSDKYYINNTGNPGMATGGTGDCLTGVIASLLGQKLDPFQSAQLGTYAHGLAGDIAAENLGQIGMIASDLPKFLPEAFNRIIQ